MSAFIMSCCCESPLSHTVRPRMRRSRSQGVNVSSDVLFWPSHRSCSSRCAAQPQGLRQLTSRQPGAPYELVDTDHALQHFAHTLIRQTA